MWQPPPTVRTDSLLSSNMHSSDASDLHKALGTSAGASVGEFWEMWDFCADCDHIILAGKMKQHQCDKEVWELCEGCDEIVVVGRMGDHKCDLTRT